MSEWKRNPRVLVLEGSRVSENLLPKDAKVGSIW